MKVVIEMDEDLRSQLSKKKKEIKAETGFKVTTSEVIVELIKKGLKK